MIIRTVRAVSFALLVSAANAFAGAPADSAPKDEAKPPVTVKVESLDPVDVGATKGDPRANFGIVNLKADTCYAFAPPAGTTVEVGESYTVIPSRDVDDEIRAKLASDYPKCAIVDVVGRSVRPPVQISE
jgi:hypothetical protein